MRPASDVERRRLNETFARGEAADALDELRVSRG
jgi:hypothetical protein